MPQDENKSISPLMAALYGIAVGAAAAYFMRKDSRDKAIKQYKTLRNKAEKVIADTSKKVDSTKTELENWAQDMGEKAEREAKKLDSRTRKVLSA